MFNKLKENIKNKLKDWLDINVNDEYAIDSFDYLFKLHKYNNAQIEGILKSIELDRNTFTANIKRIEEKLEETKC